MSSSSLRVTPPALPNELKFAAVGCLATLCLAGYVVDSGVADAALRFLSRAVETEVVLLFAPLCVLVFAMLVEVARFTGRESLPDSRPPRRQIVDWQPGHGEG